MKRKPSLQFLAILLYLAPYVHAQPWSGIIATSRAIDWSNAGVTGGIPDRTTICSTLNAGASAAQINSAISSCPSGQVVFLNAGTYNLSTGISMTSNVTLRGAGANQTKLIFSGVINCQGGNAGICVNGTYSGAWWPGPPGPNGAPASQTRNWTGTNGQPGVYTQGATVLNLASPPTGLQVGWTLMLSQNDDSSVSPTNLVVGGSCSGMSLDGSGDTYGTGQQQNVKVTAINGNAVTITPGIYMSNWRTSQSPQVYWWGIPIVAVGIENMSVDAGGVSGLPISIYAAQDSWVKGVALPNVNSGARAHIRLVQSRSLAVVDSYLYGSGGSGMLNYGVEPYDCADCLIQNNIFESVFTPILPQAGTHGLVIGYNYVASGAQHDIQFHQEGNSMNLVEGNVVNTILIDTFHGTNVFTTLFRNRLIGNGVTAIDIWANNRYDNILGNVLGTSTSVRYESSNSSSSTSGWDSNIYRLGFPYIDAVSSYARCGSAINFDSLVPNSSFRWGNYDTVNNTVRWVSSEVPISLTQYANSLPGAQTLPASFYLQGKPSSWWATPWGAPSWPAIGPDVAGGNISGVGGHAYKIPAQLCFENIGGLASFNAATCYVQSGSGSPPIHPTGLTAIVR
jgi:hypothetical protein